MTSRRFSTAVGIVLGGATFLLSPFGPRVSPDSGHYVFMTTEALRAGPFGITESWWPPGLPWLLALITTSVTGDVLTASTLLNAVSIGVVCAVIALEVGRSFDDGAKPRATGACCAALLALVLFNAAYVSEISAYVWSESPFLALITLGLFFVGTRQTFGWGVLLLAVSWSVRFIGLLTVPVIALAFFHLGTAERRAWRTVLAANLVPLTGAAMFVAGVLLFNRIGFGFWMRTAVSGPSPTMAAAATDYLGTLFGFLLNRRSPLQAIPTAVVLGVIVAAGLYRMAAAVRSRRLGSALAGTDVWLAWSLLYSLAMIWLMSHSDIFGTNRFVTPVIGSLLVVAGRGLAGLIVPRVRLVVLAVVAALAGESTVAIVRTNAASLAETRTAHRLVHEAHVRGTAGFRDADRLASRASAILFLQRDQASYFTGVMAAALFACKPFYYRRVEESGIPLPVREPLLILSEAQNASLPALLAHGQVIHETKRLGLDMALVIPTTTEISPERPLSLGCR